MSDSDAPDESGRRLPDPPPPLREALSTVMKRLVDRGRFEIERAASAGRHRLEMRQLLRDRDHFWMRLGKEAYHLVEAGEIDHPGLRRAMKRIDDLEERITQHREVMEGADLPIDDVE